MDQVATLISAALLALVAGILLDLLRLVHHIDRRLTTVEATLIITASTQTKGTPPCHGDSS